MKAKHLYLITLIGCGGLFVLLSFGINLAYLACNNNIVFFQSALPELIDMLRDIVEIFIWAIACSMLSYAILFRVTNHAPLRLSLLFGGLLLLHRVFDLAVTLIIYGSISLYEDVFYNLFYWIFDLLMIVLVWLFVSSTAKKYYRHRSRTIKTKTLFCATEAATPVTEDLYPFKKIFQKTNPLQVALCKASILFSASKLLSRLVFDLGYGAPEDFTEYFIMFIYYLSDLLSGIIFYVFAMLIFRVVFTKLQKAKKLDDVN